MLHSSLRHFLGTICQHRRGYQIPCNNRRRNMFLQLTPCDSCCHFSSTLSAIQFKSMTVASHFHQRLLFVPHLCAPIIDEWFILSNQIKKSTRRLVYTAQKSRQQQVSNYWWHQKRATTFAAQQVVTLEAISEFCGFLWSYAKWLQSFDDVLLNLSDST